MGAWYRTTAAALLLGSLLVLPTAVAASTTFSGTITAGHPATGVGVGVTELGAACDTEADLNGVDGHWFDVAAYDGWTFVLTMDATLDADVWFYDASCTPIDDGSGAKGIIGVQETGKVPSNAAYAIVNGYAGTGSFTLKLTG